VQNDMFRAAAAGVFHRFSALLSAKVWCYTL